MVLKNHKKDELTKRSLVVLSLFLRACHFFFKKCNHLGEWLFFEKRDDILPLNGGHQ